MALIEGQNSILPDHSALRVIYSRGKTPMVGKSYKWPKIRIYKVEARIRPISH